MYKFLLRSTAFAALICGAPSLVLAKEESIAKTPSLTISGEANGTVSFFRGKQREANKGREGNGVSTAIENTRINFDVEGKTDKFGGLEYGYLAGLTGNTEAGKTSIEESRIKLKGMWGLFMVGTHRGVDDRMAKGAFGVMGGTGGFAGSYTNVTSQSTGVVYKVDMVGTSKDTNKLTYATPRIQGLQFGVSFTPNSETKGEAKTQGTVNPNGDTTPFTKNNFSLGLNFVKALNSQLELKLSAVGVFGRTQKGSRGDRIARKDVKSYAFGGEMTYNKLSFGLEFVNNGHSFMPLNTNGADSGKVYSGAIGYDFGAYKVSVGHLYTKRKLGNRTYEGKTINPNATANVTSLTVNHPVAPGLEVYADATRFNYKTHQSEVDSANTTTAGTGIGKNQGHVITLGTKVRF